MQCAATGGDSERKVARAAVHRALALLISPPLACACQLARQPTGSDLSAEAWEGHSMGKSEQDLMSYTAVTLRQIKIAGAEPIVQRFYINIKTHKRYCPCVRCVRLCVK